MEIKKLFFIREPDKKSSSLVSFRFSFITRRAKNIERRALRIVVCAQGTVFTARAVWQMSKNRENDF